MESSSHNTRTHVAATRSRARARFHRRNTRDRRFAIDDPGGLGDDVSSPTNGHRCATELRRTRAEQSAKSLGARANVCSVLPRAARSLTANTIRRLCRLGRHVQPLPRFDSTCLPIAAIPPTPRLAAIPYARRATSSGWYLPSTELARVRPRSADDPAERRSNFARATERATERATVGAN